MRRVFFEVSKNTSVYTDARRREVIQQMDAPSVTSKVDHACICILGAGFQHPGTVASSSVVPFESLSDAHDITITRDRDSYSKVKSLLVRCKSYRRQTLLCNACKNICLIS